MNQARLALDYVEVLIWPLLVAAIVARFRTQIAAVIDRIRSASGPGWAVHFAEQTTREIKEEPAVVAFLAATLARKEAEITSHVVERDELTRQLAVYQVSYSFERIYRLIFGSQIRLLYYLGAVGVTGAGLNDLVPYHQDNLRLMKAVSPGYDYPLLSYLAFLEGSELIKIQDGRYYLTPSGQGFLQWMAAESVQPWKPG